jgi:hypothetical protein
MPTFFNLFALLLAVLTAVAYWWGVDNSFFWIYSWYDILLHLLGGVVMGLWAAAVAARMHLTPLRALLLVLFIGVIGGVAWELFEIAFNMIKADNYWLDTFADLGNDIVGGLVAWLLYLVLYKKDPQYEK